MSIATKAEQTSPKQEEWGDMQRRAGNAETGLPEILFLRFAKASAVHVYIRWEWSPATE